MRKNVKGVIFDFNGVLFWDTELQEKAWDDFSIKHRGLPFTEEEKVKILHGRPNRIIQEYLLKRQLSDKEIYKYTQEKETAYRALCLNDINSFKLSPGAVKLFNYLLDKNIPHTIATASERGNLDFFIKHLKLDKWFDTDIIVYDNGTFPGKPEPDIFLKAAKKHRFIPGTMHGNRRLCLRP